MIGTIQMLGKSALQHPDNRVSLIWELQDQYLRNSPAIVWTFNTRKLFRIWYSTDPNVYLPFVNQLRFIRMREHNPDAVITFIYSSRCLNETAKASLKAFCKRHNIQSIDFDLLKPEMESEQDNLFWDYANEEINQFKEGVGITAAASDFTRLNTKIMERFGHYSDFDKDIIFGILPPLISVRFPIILNAVLGKNALGKLEACVSNDFIGITQDRFNPDLLSLNAKIRIQRLQDIVIARYHNPSLVFHYEKNNPLMFCLLREAILRPYLGDIYSFRKFIQQLSLDDYYNLLKKEPEVTESTLYDAFFSEGTNYDAEFVDLIKETDLSKVHHRFEFDRIDHPNLSVRKRAELFFSHIKSIVIQDSVIGLAGPNAYAGLFRIDSDNEKNHIPTMQDRELCSIKARHLGLYFTSFNFNGLKDHIRANRLISQFLIEGDSEPDSDFSWTEEGQGEVAFATEKIRAAGKVLVSAFEVWHAKRQESLACMATSSIELPRNQSLAPKTREFQI